MNNFGESLSEMSDGEGAAGWFVSLKKLFDLMMISNLFPDHNP